MDNLHSGIIRFEVSHYQKARGLAPSLVKAFKRTGAVENFEDLFGEGESAVCHPPVGRPAPPRYDIMRRTQLSMKRATREKRNGGRKEKKQERGRKALNWGVLRFKCRDGTKRAK